MANLVMQGENRHTLPLVCTVHMTIVKGGKQELDEYLWLTGYPLNMLHLGEVIMGILCY